MLISPSSLAITPFRARVLGGAGVADPVTSPVSASIKFPHANWVYGTEHEDKTVLTVLADQSSGTGEEILVPADYGALGMLVDMNWAATLQSAGPSNYIGSGATSESAARNWMIRYGGGDPDNGLGAAKAMRFVCRGESADSAQAVRNIDLSGDTDGRMLLIARLHGGAGAGATDLAFEAYSCVDGSLIDSATAAIPAGWVGMRTLDRFAIGGRCSSSTGLPLTKGNSPFFNGAISLFFVYDGGTEITQANCQSIALGASITDILGTGNFRYAFDLSDPTNPDAVVSGAEHTDHGAKPATRVAENSSGASIGIGGTIARQSATEYLVPDQFPDGYVFGADKGATTATVGLSGKCSENGATVQVRVFGLSDGTVAKDWTNLGTVSSGTFSSTITSNLTVGWGRIEYRISTDTENANLLGYSANRVGVGYKVAPFGQSQLDIWADTSQGTNTLVLQAGSLISAFGLDRKNLSSVWAWGHVLDDEALVFSDGMRATALYLSSLSAVTMPICIVGHHEEGTGMDQWSDNALTNRKLTDSELLATLAGTDITALVHQLGTNDLPAGVNFEEQRLDPVLLGSDPGGLPFTMDNSVRGATRATGVFDSGTHLIMCPLSRHAYDNAGTPVDNFEAFGSTDDDVRIARQELVSFCTNNPTITTLGVWFDDILMDNGSGDIGPHQDYDDNRGNRRMGARMAQSIAKGLGLETIANPEIQSAARSGNTIDITISLPNGGTLVTGATQTGGSVPVGEDAVQGFEISEDAGSTWNRNGAASGVGFSAAITDAANGVVTLTRDASTWPANTLVRFNFGGPLSLDGTYGDIIEGALYEARGDEGTRGLATAIEVGIPVSGAAGPITAA